MPQRSSSTFSSEPGNWRRRLSLLGWVVAAWLAIDLIVGTVFAYPNDPKATEPGRLELYFDYGRSSEGKLRRLTRANPEEAAPITQAGWYEPLVAVERDDKNGAPEVTVYGMSHAVRLAEALDRQSVRHSVRSVGAPGATTNWSHGAFLRDKGNEDSKVVVLAIMANTLPQITSLSPMTWNRAFALPYTQDRFVPIETGIKQIKPPYESYADYVAALEKPSEWAKAEAYFAKHDPWWDSFLVKQTGLDRLVTTRLLRRAWGQRAARLAMDKIHDRREGFDPDAEASRAAIGIIRDFAEKARAKGQVPIIYVINNFGFSDHLFRLLQPTLEAETIPYLSSHEIVSPSDPRGYLPDTHFTDANDEKLARVLEALIDRELEKR